MITLTDTQWKYVKSFMPEALLTDIERQVYEDSLAKQTKFKTGPIELQLYDADKNTKKTIIVQAILLDDTWALTPFRKENSKPWYTSRNVILHYRPEGLKVCAFKNRKQAIIFYEKHLKALDFDIKDDEKIQILKKLISESKETV